MSRRALIAEPDNEEALKQAAILQDDGFEAIVFNGQDVVAEVERTTPEVLFLRQERPGSQTGLALVSRIKSIANQVAIVITTSELTPEAIEKSKKQKVHADGFVRIPADRSELLAAAQAAPAGPAPDAKTEEKGDPRRPPPLPPSGLKGLTQARAAPRGGGEAVLTADDLTFVEKVFSTIQHVDIEQNESQPPAERAEGGDRKVVLLRTELKRRERELAKLSRLWKAREEDLRQKEARVQQKDIEVEGLRMRINELTQELERANQNLVDKEAEFGRTIGETYDSQALAQAELIQQVASKENEINSLKTKLRRSEDQFAAERTAFTERVFEWEKAYAEFDQHHWKVIEASVEEIRRLESSIRAREADRRAVHETLKDRESQIAYLRARLARQRTEQHVVEHEHGLFEDRAVAVAETYVAFEKAGRIAAEDEARELRSRVLDVENDLRRHQQLLVFLDKQRQRDIARVVAVSRANDAELVRFAADRNAWRVRAEELDSALNIAKMLGEATAMQLFALEEKRRVVMDAQVAVRDERMSELREEVTRLSTNLSDVTERLGQSEMDHETEKARADELDVALQETREAAAEAEHRLATDLEARTVERDKLADSFERSEQQLAQTREELAEEKHSRKQREVEVAGLVERKDNELAAKNEKLVEIERSLGDAREDIQNLRKTVTLRDDRITELLNRVRQADEQQVALEGQVYRLTATSQEKDVELSARAERLEVAAQKAQQREERIDALEQEVRKGHALAQDKQAQLDRQDQSVRQLQAEIASAREEHQRLKGELDGRAQELFESERKSVQLQGELSNARAEIETGGVVNEQLQAQLKAHEARAHDLKRVLDDTDAKLRNTLVDLDAAGQRAEQMRAEIAELREHAAGLDAEVQAQRGQITEIERARDAQAETSAQLQARLAESEAEGHAFEEQLAAQLRENAELSQSLSDASQRLEEAATQRQTLEAEIGQREGRIAAQAQILVKAEQSLAQKDAEIAELNESLQEARGQVDDARASIDERARWLATREQSIAELKAQLDAEKKAHEDAQVNGQNAQQQLVAMKKAYDELRARLEERERLLQAQGQHSASEIEREMARAERLDAEAKESKAALAALHVEAERLRVEAARVPELKAAEEKIRGDALKLRQIAERAANDAKAARILLEKTDAAKKAAEAEALKARAEIEDIRTAQRQSDAFVTQARVETEQRNARLRELEGQVQRAVAARDASERARAEAEQEAARVRSAANEGAAGAAQGLQADVARLTAELQAAKKAQADAMAAARQAKAEAEQIKRLAAEKIRQVQAAAQARTTQPPAPAAHVPAPAPVPAPVPAPAPMPPRPVPMQQNPLTSDRAQPTMVLQRPGTGPASMAGLAPPAGAPVTNPGVHMPAPTMPGTALPTMPTLPSDAPDLDEAYGEEKTVMVQMPEIPPAARGDKT